ncbi:MAG: septum formation protein Maf [Promethearchaeota archaeon Loki_b31]|nr:MAG: septum formation protein Maf [Candidatus Lokiarchaeota archaeon Loki_b31]
MKKIILASKSIDRKKTFNRLNIPFETIITDIDEAYYKGIFSNPVELVKEIAKAKALRAKDLLKNKKMEAIIIAADTIVEFKGKIIGKAKNKAQAFQILKSLINRSHNLITGVAITELNDPKVVVDYDCTIVTFLDISDNEIRNYINTEEWKGRAGAYSIRDRASLFIKEIRGSPSNVIGLPMQKIFEILKKDFSLNLFDT